MSDPILEIRHVTKQFPASGGRFLTANNDVNLFCYEGETLGVVGESGCGKSTLIRMVMQLEEPTSGQILFRDVDLASLRGRARRQARRHIQMFFQDPSDAFSPKMKIKNITMIFICHDISLVHCMSHRTAVMYLGNIMEVVPSRQLCTGLMHPYTEALKEALFSVDMDFEKPIESIESEAPSPLDVPAGCPFRDRCGRCMPVCRSERPELKEVEPGHVIACHLF